MYRYIHNQEYKKAWMVYKDTMNLPVCIAIKKAV